MGYFQDMGLLFIYSLIVLLWKEPDRTLIFAILWAVILICGIYFIHGKSTKVLVCIVFALMALVVPEIEMFYPILIYALIKEINWQMGLAISMAGVILLGKYGDMHIEIMAKYVVGCLLAAILERKTYKYDKMDIELRKTVDSGEEKALLLSEKNKALAEALEKSGLMTDFGRAKIEEAKKNGQWEGTALKVVIGKEQIDSVAELLKGNEQAYANFLNMSPSVQKTYTRAYLDARTEAGRVKRLAWMTERLEKNLKPM